MVCSNDQSLSLTQEVMQPTVALSPQQNHGNLEQLEKHSSKSSKFSIDSRVVIYDKKGAAIHGTVKLTGMLETESTGIEMVSFCVDLCKSSVCTVCATVVLAWEFDSWHILLLACLNSLITAKLGMIWTKFGRGPACVMSRAPQYLPT